jgi:hypothetical protein
MSDQLELWQTATSGLAKHMPIGSVSAEMPEGAIIQDQSADEDTIAVVYNKGETPPTITVTKMSPTMRAVQANGVTVAIVARADGPDLKPEDVVLVERYVSNAP